MESGFYMNKKGGYLKYPESYNDKIPYFNRFMDRYSQSHWGQKRNQLIKFALYIEEKHKKKILNANVDDVISFFEILSLQVNNFF